jgi:hypothetical protein
MKRSQRRTHSMIWPLLALVMLATLAAAVVVRDHPAPAGTTATEPR